MGIFRQLSYEARQQIEERAKDEPDNAERDHQAEHMPVSDVLVVSKAANKDGEKYNFHHEFCLLHGS